MSPPFQQLVITLKKARKAENLSQRVLADKLGIPQSHLSKIEAGRVNIGLAGFVEMARMLELEVMLVPRQEVSLVKGLMEAKSGSRQTSGARPAYSLDKEEENKED